MTAPRITGLTYPGGAEPEVGDIVRGEDGNLYHTGQPVNRILAQALSAYRKANDENAPEALEQYRDTHAPR